MSSDGQSRVVLFLFLVALLADLFFPFLIWKGIVPVPMRWLSHAVLALLVLGAFARMMVPGPIPGAFWAIVGMSAISVTVALMEGQGALETAWGWWKMFTYPMVGLFAYLLPQWPDRFPERFRRFCVALLAFEVVVQVGQFLTGEPPGDFLAGTFGRNGVSMLLLFDLFVLCLALGQWLAWRQWKTLLAVLALGGVSSVLGEMKLFPVAAVALSACAVVLGVPQVGRRLRLVPYAVVVALLVIGFARAYDEVVVASTNARPLESFLDFDRASAYLGGRRMESQPGEYYTARFGRNYAVSYGWNSIQGDPVRLLFGLGLGARGESLTLGAVGVGLERGDLGLTSGTSLLVMMQELGLAGLAVMVGFCLWVCVRLYRDIKSDPQSEVVELRYALLLFSILWPLWLWYKHVWVMRVAMLLYWACLGYVLGEAQRRRSGVGELRPAVPPLRGQRDMV